MKLTFKVKELCETDDWMKETDGDYGRLVMKECPDFGRTWHWVMVSAPPRGMAHAYFLDQWDDDVMEYIEENMPCIISYESACVKYDSDGEDCECKLGRSYDVSYTCLTDDEFDLVCKARSMFVAGADEDDDE